MSAQSIQQGDLNLEVPTQSLNPNQIKLLQGGLKALGHDIPEINGIADDNLQNALEDFFDENEQIKFDPEINQAALHVVRQAVSESAEVNTATQELAENYTELNILERVFMQIVLALQGYLTPIDGSHNEDTQNAVSQFLQNGTPDPSNTESLGFVGRAIQAAGGNFNETEKRDLGRSTFDALRVESEFRPSANAIANQYIKDYADHLPEEHQNLLKDSVRDFEAIEVTQEDIIRHQQIQIQQGVDANRDWLASEDIGIIENTPDGGYEILDQDRFDKAISRYVQSDDISELSIRRQQFGEQYPGREDTGSLSKHMGLRSYYLERKGNILETAAQETANMMRTESNEMVANLESIKDIIQNTANQDPDSPNRISMADSLVAINPEGELDTDQIKLVSQELGVDPNTKFDITNPEELNSLLLGVAAYQNDSTIGELNEQTTNSITQVADLSQSDNQQVADLEHKPEESIAPS